MKQLLGRPSHAPEMRFLRELLKVATRLME